MHPTDKTLLSPTARSHWLRLRTLILLRWLAITGQIVALVFATAVLELRIELAFAILAVLASVFVNVVSMLVFPENRRLQDGEAMATLLFDLTQLAVLLFLTGGLNNPFALLIIAPVTIAATALSLRSTIILGLAAIAFVSFIAYFSLPLVTHDGAILEQPRLFNMGFWLALVIGIVFVGAYARRVSIENNSMSEALHATQMALSREQNLTDLGGVVAAAAHELGTPLATIKLVSSEMAQELPPESEMKEDAELIREQADRCRDILRSMGRAGKDDLLIRTAPLSSVVETAAEPHAGRGKEIHYSFAPLPGIKLPHPSIYRKPEIIHGLRNLVQNAVDFAKSDVWLNGSWDADNLYLRIADDGKGFPAHVIGRIGDPFISMRKSGEKARRPGYEGMGLGLFIAKTLLERTGAEITFANGADPFQHPDSRPTQSGAVVELIWKRAAICPSEAAVKGPLGENRPIS